MIIDWYPGHMKKAREQIIKKLPTIDVVIEVLDARLPVSSANPLLTRLRGTKPCIKVLNKSDLADPAVTGEWVRCFEKQQGVRALPLIAKDHRDAGRLLKLCRTLVPTRGGKGERYLQVMVIGIPNVGKSTLINTLTGKKVARVGDKPAVTTCQQLIDLHNGILLSDTPGLLWPMLEDQQGACRLAASGAIGDNAFDTDSVALATLSYLSDRYPALLLKRYNLPDLPASPTATLAEIGRRRGCLVSGGEVDRHRAAELFLRELRAGLLGGISLERPGDPPESNAPSAARADDAEV
ncbi:MAG: ribosome biogenesis GTPase YlqF [Desulfuromonas sp.]|nr:ribosome biogenesis GTPase YlqF [Desulfuromonas sp.]